MTILGHMNLLGGVLARSGMGGLPGPPAPPPAQSVTAMGIISDENNPGIVDLSTAVIVDFTSETAMFTLGPTVLNDFLMFFIPDSFTIVTIEDPEIPVNEFVAYTVTTAVRTINLVSYTSYVLGPLNAGLTFVRRVSTS